MEQARDADARDCSTTFPVSVLVAGIIWIGFGCLVFLGGLVNGVLFLILARGTPQEKALMGGVHLLIFTALAGAWIAAGVPTVRGTAKGLLVRGLASLAFGLLNLGLSALFLIGALFTGPPNTGLLAGSLAAVFLIAGLALSAAGFLAIQVRHRYEVWRQPGY